MEQQQQPQSLRRLVQDSRHLANMLTTSSIIQSPTGILAANDTLALPILQRGLEQIEALSVRLAEKTGSLHAAAVPSMMVVDSKANLLLATKGFNVDKAQQSLGRVVTNLCMAAGDANGALAQIDANAHVQELFEGTVLGICNSLYAYSAQQTDSLLQRKASMAWERAKRSLLEITPRSVKEGSSSSSSVMVHRSIVANPKAQAFLGVVKRINEARRTRQSLPVAGLFGKALAAIDGGDLRTEQLVDCWTALGTILGETGAMADEGRGGSANDDRRRMGGEDNVFSAEGGSKGSSSHRLAPIGSSESRRWQRAFTRGSRRFLQEQFRRFVDRTLTQYPRDALVGGRPSPAERVKAYAQLRWKRMAPAELERLEVLNQPSGPLPIWMVLFYLLRAGLFEEAIRLVQAQEEHFHRLQPASLLAYLRAAFELIGNSEASGITGHLLAQLRSEYAQLLMMSRQDPFKLAILKILGRCDLSHRSVPEAIQTSEDYLWMQLWLIDADPIGKDPSLADQPRYSLADLQKSVTELGAAYFDPRGNNPVRFFQILLLTGQYESAIGFLASSFSSSSTNTRPQYLIDAVHFAICLAYHSSLRLVPNPDPALWETVIDGLEVNLAIILDSYARQVATADRMDALQYLLLISLPDLETYDRYCRDCIRDAVLEAGDVGALLGDIARDGSLIEGYLSRYLKLLHLPDQAAFMSEITVQAAQQCQRDGRIQEAMQLYNIAGDYGRVLGLLARQAATLFATGVDSGGRGGRGGRGGEEFLTFLATSASILDYYMGNLHIQTAIDREALRLVRDMRTLLEARHAYEAERWSEAVELVQSLGFIPAPSMIAVGTDAAAISRAADVVKRMPDLLAASFPQALLLVMSCLHHIFLACKPFAYTDAGRQSLLEQTRSRSRAIVLLLGMVRMRVSADICAQITRIDVLINEGA